MNKNYLNSIKFSFLERRISIIFLFTLLTINTVLSQDFVSLSPKENFVSEKETIGWSANVFDISDYEKTESLSNFNKEEIFKISYTNEKATLLNPGGVSGAKLWLKANVGGANWTDQSGSGVTVTKSGSPSVLTNSLNFNSVVNFSGSFQYYNLNSNLGFDGGVTTPDHAVYVVLIDDKTSGFGSILGGQSTGQGALQYLAQGSNPRSIYVDQDGWGAPASSDAGIQVGQPTLVATTFTKIATNNSTVSHYFNGALNKTVTNFPSPFVASANTRLGARATSSGARDFFRGKIAEIVVYGNNTSTTRDKIESYLAIKYGITLNNGTVAYRNSAGANIWTVNAGYPADIFGIINDATQQLNQQISKSVNSGTILTVSTDTNFTGANGTHASLVNGSSIMFGNNGSSGALTTSNTTDLDVSKYTTRTAREWRSTNLGVNTSVNLKFDGYNDEWVLLKRTTDGNFSSTTGTTELPLSSAGTVSTTLPAQSFFTLAKKIVVVNHPGGVSGDLALWLKADADFTPAVWRDKSGTNNNAVQATTAKQASLVANVLNFNPGVTFSGDATFASSDYYTTSNTISLSQNASIFTVTTRPAQTSTGSSFRPVFASNEVWGATGTYNGYWIGYGSGNLEARASAITNSGVVNRINGPNAANTGGFLNTLINTNRSLELFGNGISAGTKTTSANTTGTALTYEIGQNSISASTGFPRPFKGEITEIIAYKKALSAAEALKVNSYLAIKYGITLKNGTTAYVSSAGANIWVADTNYPADIFGIINDKDAQGLNQQISKSINNNTILTVSTDTNFTGANGTHASLDDGDSIMFGNNGASGALTTNNTTNLDATKYSTRTARQWKSTNLGVTTAVNLKFDGYNNDWVLLTRTDGNFSATSGTTETPLSASGTVAVNLPSASYFTLAKKVVAPPLDTDNDGIPDATDVDDDNDGILDTVEGLCTPLASGSWSGTTTPRGSTNPFTFSTTSTAVGVDMTLTFSGNADNFGSNPSANFGSQSFYTSNSGNLINAPSALIDIDWDGTPDSPNTNIDASGDDKGSGTLTLVFDKTVIDPVIHLDRLGGTFFFSGTNQFLSNSLEFTLVSAGTMTKLSGTDDFLVTSNTVRREAGIVVNDNNPESAQSRLQGAAAGSILIKGTFDKLEFTWTGVGFEGNGGDAFEIIVEACNSIDTDNDGILNHLDLDSDNDGIPDNIEAQTTAGWSAGSGTVNTTGSFPGLMNNYGSGFTPVNTDNDANADYLDKDSDNDGFLDTIEAGLSLGGVNTIVNGMDDNSDGSANTVALPYAKAQGRFTNPSSNFPDADNNTADADYRSIADTDGDGVLDNADEDDDDDGILDSVEALGFDPKNTAACEFNRANFDDTAGKQTIMVDQDGDGTLETTIVTGGVELTTDAPSGFVGDKYTFYSVVAIDGFTLDAIVEITQADANITSLDIDNDNTGNAAAWQAEYNVPAGQTAKMSFKMTFVLANTQTVVPLKRFGGVFYDIDGANANETITLENPELFAVEDATLLNIVRTPSGGVQFTGPTTTYPGVDLRTDLAAYFNYYDISSFEFSTTAVNVTNSDNTNFFSLLFDPCAINTFTAPKFSIGDALDSDNDGKPNHLDTDSDGDGCFDAIEAAGNITAGQLNADGSINSGSTPNGVPTLVGASGQGLTEAVDQVGPDVDNDGIADACDPTDDRGDFDFDGVANDIDLDDDNDGILDEFEGGPSCVDSKERSLNLNATGNDAYTENTNLVGSLPLTLDEGNYIFDATLVNGSNDGGTPQFTGNGIQIKNDFPSVNDYIYVQPRNVGQKASGDYVEYEFKAPTGKFFDSFTFIYAGLNYGDYAEVTAFDENGTAISITQANFSEFIPALSSGNWDVNGNKVVGNTRSGGTDVTTNEFRVTVSQKVSRVVIVSGKADNSNGTVTAGFHSVIACKPASGLDTDNDGKQDYIDTDSDGDGCSDANEAYYSGLTDGGDGFQFGTGDPLTLANGGVKADGTVADSKATYPGNNAAVLDKNINTACIDTDNDGVIDVVDEDDDNDGILDTDEGCVALNSTSFTLNTSKSNTGDSFSDENTPLGKLVYEDTFGNQVILEAVGSRGNNNGITANGPRDGTIVTNTTTGAIAFEIGSNDVNDQPQLRVTALSASGTPFNINSIGFGNIGNMDNSSAKDVIGANVPGTWSNITSSGNTLSVAQIVKSPPSATPVSDVTQSQLNTYNFSNFVAQGAVSEVIFNNGDNNVQFGYNATFSPSVPTSSFNLIIDDFIVAPLDNNGRNILAELITTTLSISGFVCRDSDGDGIEDRVDTDSDGDGCSDADEGYLPTVFDADDDNDGLYGSGTPIVNSTNGRVVAASYPNPNETFYLDANLNGCIDTDNDDVPNILDEDDDNDGILDTVEEGCTNAVTGEIAWDTNFGFSGTRANFQNDLPRTSGAIDRRSVTLSYTDPNNHVSEISVVNGFNFGNVLEIEHGVGLLGGSTTTFEFNEIVNDLTFELQDIDTRTGSFEDLLEVRAYLIDGTEFIITSKNIVYQGDHVLFEGNNTFRGNPSKGNAPNGDIGGKMELFFDQPIKKIDFKYSNVDATKGTSQRIGIANLKYKEVCNPDFDKDGIPDSLDTDSDGDGCSDADEAYYPTVANADVDNNGKYGSSDPAVTSTGRVVAASYAAPKSFQLDAGKNVCSDNDGDLIADFEDLDDDNDGVLDSDECPGVLRATNGDFDVPITGSNPVLTQTFTNGITITYTNTGSSSIAKWAEPTNDADELYAIGTNFQYVYPNENSVQQMTFSSPVRLQFMITDIDQYSERHRVTVYDKDGVIIPNPEKYIRTSVEGTSGSSFASRTATTYTDIGDNVTVNGAINDNFVELTQFGNTGNDDTFTRKNLVFFDFGEQIISRIDVANLSTSGQPGFLFDSIRIACDTDNDGTPNYLDTDSDNDNCPDAIEAAGNFQSSNLVNPGTDDSLGDVVETNTSSTNYGVPILSGNSTQQATTVALTDNTIKDACLVDLSLLKTIDKPIKKVGETIVFTITLKNEGDSDATNVMVKDLLPAGLTYNAASSVVPTNTTYVASTGIWDLSLLTIKKGETKVLKIGATVTTAGTIITNKTEIFSATESDKDSTSNSNN